MANLFDSSSDRFAVLVNDRGEHSLWPVFAEVPDGWTVVLGDSTREDCLAHVEKHWTGVSRHGE